MDGTYPAEFNGQYTFASQTASGGTATTKNIAQNLVSTGIDYSLSTGFESRYGGNISLDWHKNPDFQAYLRATYANETLEQDTYNFQYYGTNVSSTEIGTTGVYTPVIGAIDPRYYYETAPEQAELSTLQFGFNWRSGDLHLSPNVFGSWGEDNEPNHIEFNGRDPENGPYMPFGGSVLFAPSGNGPIPLVPSAEAASVYNFGGYGLRRAGEVSTSFSNQGRGGAKIDGGYDFHTDWLKDISFGLKFESSERNHTSRDYTSDEVFTSNADDPTLSSVPFISGTVKNLVPGVINVSAPLVNQGALFKYFNAAVAGKGLNNYSDICPGYTSPTDPNPPPNGSFQDTYNCNTQRGIEQVSSAYISGNFMLGGVQIIPGLRFEHTDIHNDFYVLENNSVGHFASDSTKYDKLLPSIAANYRPNALTVYRAAIWTSYVKPSMFQLGGGEQISFSPDSSSPTGETENITKSNPNLKPIDAINYDASGEWRNTFGGYAVVAVFYKSLNHFTYSQVDSYTNQTSGGSEFVTVSTPENGGSGRVYGLELTGRQKFTGMPAPFNGFGLASNLTLERSAVHTEEAGLDPTERLQDQPNTTANAQLFYEKGPISAQLSYRYTGSYVAGYSVLGDGGPASSQLDAWVQDSTRLDLHVAYRLPSGLSLEASASNLLDAPSAYETIGKNTNIIPDIVNSGRTFDFVARYSF